MKKTLAGTLAAAAVGVLIAIPAAWAAPLTHPEPVKSWQSSSMVTGTTVLKLKIDNGNQSGARALIAKKIYDASGGALANDPKPVVGIDYTFKLIAKALDFGQAGIGGGASNWHTTTNADTLKIGVGTVAQIGAFKNLDIFAAADLQTA